MWAVHISDGILLNGWWVGSFALAGLLAVLSAWRVRDEEIPRIALLTAVFFVVSSLPVRVGPGSAHLLMSGLLGVVLGRRASLAILVGVALQAVLLGHGGSTTIGINTCIMSVPALLAWQLFAGLKRLPWLGNQWFRTSLVGLSVLVWSLSAVYGLVLLLSRPLTNSTDLGEQLACTNAIVFDPLTLTAIVFFVGFMTWVERRLENSPEFPIGLLVGEISVLMTAFLNYLVLLFGAAADLDVLALTLFVVHLPMAAIEGIIVGFTVGFLVRVKPEMIGWLPLETNTCSID